MPSERAVWAPGTSESAPIVSSRLRIELNLARSGARAGRAGWRRSERLVVAELDEVDAEAAAAVGVASGISWLGITSLTEGSDFSAATSELGTVAATALIRLYA